MFAFLEKSSKVAASNRMR